ncbi:MAG: hypothetical protein ACK2U1_03325 [Anaerolineales bacterium]
MKNHHKIFYVLEINRLEYRQKNLMNPLTLLQYLTGFLMGAFLGFGLTAAIQVIYNFYCLWRGCVLVDFTWWIAIPLPLLLGICMSKFIANLKLEDY